MVHTGESWIERYQPWRRRVEVGFWVAVLVMQVVFNTAVTWIDLRRSIAEFPLWQPFVWELSSNLAVGLLIPVIFAFERRFPLHWRTLPRNLSWHLAGSAAFCAVHVAIMLALRFPAYALMGEQYRVGDLPLHLSYEYLKDVRSYALILAAVLSYRLLLLRLQGEARVLDPVELPPWATEAPPPPTPLRPERFLVRKMRKEFLIVPADIEWLQAQGNYVGLHVNGHDYLLRSTLADFLGQLDPARFTRVHRSYAVNLDRVAVIEPTDGGDAQLRMKDGSQVPCSRRYRTALV